MDCVEIGSGVHARELDEALLGPPLLIALALQGTWAFHASAVLWAHYAVAMIGESGAGKSTLASRLAHQYSVRRIADDVLPLKLASHTAVCAPHYPQLRLAQTEQYPGADPDTVPLHALFVLSADHTRQSSAHRVRIEPLRGADAATALLRYTVAARLFSPDVLASHLAFCSTLVSMLPVYRVDYPHTSAAIAQFRDTLEGLFAGPLAV